MDPNPSAPTLDFTNDQSSGREYRAYSGGDLFREHWGRAEWAQRRWLAPPQCLFGPSIGLTLKGRGARLARKRGTTSTSARLIQATMAMIRQADSKSRSVEKKKERGGKGGKRMVSRLALCLQNHNHAIIGMHAFSIMNKDAQPFSTASLIKKSIPHASSCFRAILLWPSSFRQSHSYQSVPPKN